VGGVRMRRPVRTPAHRRCLPIGRRFCEMKALGSGTLGSRARLLRFLGSRT
jgi:hypothetical protein